MQQKYWQRFCSKECKTKFRWATHITVRKHVPFESSDSKPEVLAKPLDKNSPIEKTNPNHVN